MDFSEVGRYQYVDTYPDHRQTTFRSSDRTHHERFTEYPETYTRYSQLLRNMPDYTHTKSNYAEPQTNFPPEIIQADRGTEYPRATADNMYSRYDRHQLVISDVIVHQNKINGNQRKIAIWRKPTKRCICTSQNNFRSFKLERDVPVGQALDPKSNEVIIEKRQQSIPKKEIECSEENCLKRKFATSEKNSSEKHLTTEGLGLSSSDVEVIKKHFEDNESSDDSVDEENSVCIDRVESAVIQTYVRIDDYELKAVIDTGAEVTVLSEKLKTATRGLLVAEEGEKMSATGITEIEMSLEPLRFTWPVYVARLNEDLLLGCDIIDEMDITVNTKRGIQIKDIWYPCEVKRREDKY
ncbi:Hypothetical predicted protein [Mytilus galloprovincialis]|uniref:Peptidase A2 domain-containing protein n=1 Tax=Mytilus galloprovincialis TaxID=29158 RepID=A0A8B6BSS3_MYTGA|nr:Hypothetical predicted protein [Mytilus galloprovincialis]